MLAAGFASSFIGANKASKAQQYATDQANYFNQLAQKEAQGFLQAGKGDAIGAQKKGILDANKAIDAALGTAGTVGAATRSRIERRERQALGAADASAANRGMYNSSSAVNASRGVRSDTNQALAGVDEATAGLITQIHQRRAQVAMAGGQGLASIYSPFAGNQAQTAMANQHIAANVGGAYASAGNSLAQLLMTYKPSSSPGAPIAAPGAPPGAEAMTVGGTSGTASFANQWQGPQQQLYGPQPTYSTSYNWPGAQAPWQGPQQQLYGPQQQLYGPQQQYTNSYSF